MPTPPIAEEDIEAAVAAVREHGGKSQAAEALGWTRAKVQRHMRRAAERGLLGTEPVLEGYYISKETAVYDKDGDLVREFIQQKPEKGEAFAVPEGHSIKGVSALVDPSGREIVKWIKTNQQANAQLDFMRAAVAGFKDEIPRAKPIAAPGEIIANLLNAFLVTDSHFGMLAWGEETGSDYDLRIAEQLLLDWFSAAIANAPDAHTALFGQIGDLMHHDALESVTPAHRHVLDADSRLQKIIRVVIRTIRRVIDMLLHKHQHVHVVMASGNHDPASSAWLRELLAAFYENEPRVSVDNSPSLYYAYEWGDTALFLHHGHKRDIGTVDATLAGQFRELYGRSKYAFAHIGHKHSDEGKKTGLMYVERHETLAGRDAHAAGGGWLSGRSAKVVTYSKRSGEVFRSTLRPEMVAGASGLPVAANDNEPMRRAA